MISQAAAGIILDPGLGKTSCSLAASKILLDQGYVNRILVIAPLRPCYLVWPAEIAKLANFHGLKYHILHGSGRNPWEIPEDTQIVIMNPEGLLWLLDQRYPKRFSYLDCDMLIVDESTKFKDSTTKRFKLLRKEMYRFKRRYILTGTFAPNGLLDLFGQIFLLDGGNALGQYITHYRREYFTADPWNPYSYEPQKDAFERITERISPLCIQMDAEDYINMPELIPNVIEVDLPKKARDLYDQVEDEFFAELECGTPLFVSNAAVAGQKCRQIANGGLYVPIEKGDGTIERQTFLLHQEKRDAVVDLVEQLQGNPALILYEFQHELKQLQKVFLEAPTLSGATPKQSEQICAMFNAGELPVLLGHPMSMGHGLNLQGGCHHVIWHGITWNFEHYDQTIRRVYRQGQENEHVTVHFIAASNTRDQKAQQVLADKEATQDKLNAGLSSR